MIEIISLKEGGLPSTREIGELFEKLLAETACDFKTSTVEPHFHPPSQQKVLRDVSESVEPIHSTEYTKNIGNG